MKITGPVKELLKRRGITEEKDIEEYMSPRPRVTYDPFLMKGMKEATELILSHANKGSRICIYGDYDCDGVTAVYLLSCVLAELMERDKIDHYIPSRFTEGYGLNNEAIKEIADRGTNLIITVDLGISQSEEVEYAKSLGMDIIVTDHHNTGTVIPDCIVLDPKQEDCGYPFDGICGCGVAYKLSQALQRTVGFDRSVILRLLDIAGIATIGDVVPLVDENRTIAKYGLYEIKTGRRENIRILLEEMSRDYTRIDSYGISFGIVPHINAAGRMSSAETALALLEADNTADIRENAQTLAQYNAQRKSVQQEAFERSMELMETQCPDSLLPVIRDDEAHEGIVGIVAGKICEKLHRPVIVLTEKDGKLKGSGRSIDEVDLFSVVSKSRHLLERFGGHKAACGLTIDSEEKLELLRKELDDEMKRLVEEESDLLNFEGKYDMVLEPEEVTLRLAEEIQSMEPFGNGNEKPAFRINDMQLSRGFLMGEMKNHLKFNAEKNGRIIECVMFYVEPEYVDIVFKEPVVDIIGKASVNEFRGRRSVQFIVDRILEKQR